MSKSKSKKFFSLPENKTFIENLYEKSKFDYYDYDKYLCDCNINIPRPKHADEIYSEFNGTPVCAYDFYADIFHDFQFFEEHKETAEEYEIGKYAGIIIEFKSIFNAKTQKYTKHTKRYSVTQNQEIFDIINNSSDDCFTSCFSYAGKNRNNKNVRDMYAIVIEIDDLKEETGLKELFYSFERANQQLPRPTYVVCSGNGIHLYYVFKTPIPVYSNIFKSFSKAKRYLTDRLWTKYVSSSDIQYESLNQAFRLVGTRTKRNGIVCAFKIGDKIDIKYLNKFLPSDLQINNIYKSSMSLEQAKKLYPEWYKRRVVEKKERGTYKRHAGIYKNWKKKILEGAAVGHRYYCLENLCSLAVQCDISPEQLETDCKEIADYFDTLTIDESNHFTTDDIICAMRTYYTHDISAFLRNIDVISDRTGIPLYRTKRNGRTQENHLKRIRALQEFDDEDNGTNWRDGNGRKPKKEIVKKWRENNPQGKKADCIRETGLSKNTVYKWWDTL